MTEDEINEIEERCKLTTPGPWKSLIEGRDIESGSSFIITGISYGVDIWSDKRGEEIYLTGATTADQDFIAHARQDIPKLIAEIKKLKSM